MSTKRELVELAHALGKRLGVEVDVERKNHEALTELVEELRLRVQSAEADDTAEAEDGDETSPETSASVSPGIFGGVRRAPGLRGSESAPPSPLGAPQSAAPGGAPPPAGAPRSAAKAAVYRVAAGKVLTTLRGFRRAGAVVAAGDLAGGQRTIELLLDKGAIEKQ